MHPRVTRVVAVCAAAAVLTACGVFQTAAAVVNGHKISDARFQRLLSFVLADPRFADQLGGQLGEAQRKDLTRQLLTFLVHNEVIATYADANGIDVSDDEVDLRLQQQTAEGSDIEGQIERSDASEGDVRDLLRDEILREKVADHISSQTITEERLRQEYEDRRLELSTIHVAHILVSSESEARDLLRRATPANFARLARTESIDQGSAADGGDLGTRPAADLARPFAEAAIDAPVGKVVGPVETDFGFHLILVKDRETQPFEEVRPQLEDELAGQAFADWLLGQLRHTDIRINPRYGILDPSTGQVVERRSTSPPPPAVQLTP